MATFIFLNWPMQNLAPSSNLADRTILVTGAGQGIGRKVAFAFAQQGANVILHGKHVKQLESVYDEILASGGAQPIIYPLDLEKADEAIFNAMAEGIYQQTGRLDGILHNASRFDNLSPLEIQTVAQLNGMLATHLVAPFALTKACLPLLKRSPDASVIFTSTTAAHHPAAFWGAHAISKSATETMANIWAQELEVFPNIRINTIIPGAVQTPQRSRSHPGEDASTLPDANTLLPLYLYLMGSDSTGISGRLFEGLPLNFPT